MTAAARPEDGAVSLSWPARSDMQSWKVYRVTNGTTTLVQTLAGSATGCTISGLGEGRVHDLRVSGRTTAARTLTGAVRAGFAVPLREDRGTLLMVVEESVASVLEPEIGRLRADLSGEGWKVKTLSADQHEPAAGVRGRIQAEWSTDPASHRAVLLLGHVPVLYSGSLAPDGHSDHTGAWPADCLYGEMDAALTDSTVNLSSAVRPENHNVPGDTKPDLTRLTGTQEMCVGRIDFAGLSCLAPETEISLLRRYLDRNHAWRTGQLAAEPRAVIQDGLASLNEAFSAPVRSAWPGIFGPGGVVDAAWTSQPAGISTFSYVTGYGSFSSVTGVGSAADLTARPPSAVFTLWFGSYFGDWDSGDNFLRAAIAAPGAALTAVWSGRPHFQSHGMGMGGTVGESLLESLQQANDGTATPGYFPRSVHLALMGDPTLTLRCVPQPGNAQLSIGAGERRLSWHQPADTAGVHIWRRSSAESAWTRLTAEPETDGSFEDTASFPSGAEYLVRAVRLEQVPAGSWWNASTGILLSSVAAAQHPLDEWKVEHLSAVSALMQQDTADPDADGRSNLLEYALGSLPLIQDAAEPLSLHMEGGSLVAEWQQAMNRPGVQLRLECSADLGEWITAEAEMVNSADGRAALRLRLSTSESRCFLRLSVVRQ